MVTWLRQMWRGMEARIRRSEEEIPPAIAQFAIDEIVPLKGFNFKVGYIAKHGIVLTPVGFTGAMRKKIESQLREERRTGERRAVGERYVAQA